MANIGSAVSGAAKGAAAGNSVLPGIGGFVGGALGFIGGLFGGKRNPSPAEIAADKYLEELQALGVPPAEALAATYQRLQSQGQLTPEMEQTFFQADSEMKAIQEDPALREGQTRALEALRRESEQQGMTLEDRLAINQANMAADTKTRGANEAIIQNMQARGQGGAGAELALRAMNEQAAQQSNAMRSAQIASDARKRALDAVLNAGNLSGNIRGQDFNQAERTAAAQDAINRFNVANRQNVEGSNVGARNRAQELNLTEAQRIADANTGLTNKEADNRVGATKSVYDMQLEQADKRLKARSGMAGATEAADSKAASGLGKTLDAVTSGVESLVNTFGKK